MGFFDYEKARVKYRENAFVLETIDRLEDFDEFHCLRNSSLLVGCKAAKLLPYPNQQYITWASVCDGGMLFDTTLLSVVADDPEMDIEFSTLSEYNNEEQYEEFGLPKGFFCIGIRSYGDPICLSDHDEKVYLWDCEKQEIDTIWETFFDFLADEVDSSIELIAKEVLEPIPIKFP
jgi:hypothetical protein